MRDFFREHAWAIVLSTLLHGSLVAALVAAALISAHRAPPSMQPLPIEAGVVDSQVLHAAQRVQSEHAAQAEARVRAAADAARAAEQAKAAAAEVAEAKKTAEAAADQAKAAEEARAVVQATKAAETARAAANEAKAAEEARTAAAAAAAAAADLAAQAKRAADARKAAEAKQAADAKQAAAAKQIADAKRAADDHAKADREAELRRQMADEEHRAAVESGPLRDKYAAQLRNAIQRVWIKPPSATVGLDCLVEVTQLPGGEVTNARVTQCNGDAAARQSIENAVYRASPLPEPPDPALFEKKFSLRFKPDE